MKTFKKVMAMGLATMAAISTMSMSAFAYDSDENNASYEIYSLTQEETRARGFEIINGDIYDLNGNMLIDMTEDGFTPDGYTLDPAFRVSSSSHSGVSSVSLYSTTIANATFTLYLNTSGEQSVDIGSTFTLSSEEPDVYVKYNSGTAGAVNFGLVNINRNSVVDWIPSVTAGSEDYLHGYASTDDWKLIASAQKEAGNARIYAYTAKDEN